MYISVNGTSKKVKKMYIGVDGAAKLVKTAYIGIDGISKKCYSDSDDIFAYTLDTNNKTAEISLKSTVNNATLVDIEIPSTVAIDGVVYSVITIGDYAFCESYFLKNVTIPNSVTTIGVSAFSNCYELEKVIVGNNVTFIGDYAFEYCKNLTEINISSNVTAIGACAFLNCSNLQSVELSTTQNIDIQEGAFSGTPVLTKDSDYDCVFYIGKHLIYATSDLSGEYTIRSGTLSIGHGAFESCTNLNKITTAFGLFVIPTYAFKGCTGLTSVHMNLSYEDLVIKAYAFDGCSSLTTATWTGNASNNGFNIIVEPEGNTYLSALEWTRIGAAAI